MSERRMGATEGKYYCERGVFEMDVCKQMMKDQGSVKVKGIIKKKTTTKKNENKSDGD